MGCSGKLCISFVPSSELEIADRLVLVRRAPRFGCTESTISGPRCCLLLQPMQTPTPTPTLTPTTLAALPTTSIEMASRQLDFACSESLSPFPQSLSSSYSCRGARFPTFRRSAIGHRDTRSEIGSTSRSVRGGVWQLIADRSNRSAAFFASSLAYH
jgi:hypothetical protein